MTEIKLPLHRKYRPNSFEELYGNRTTLKALKQKVEEGITTTFLFYGKRGTGKTTAARIVAKELGASSMDTFEYDTADVGLKDFARSQKTMVRFAPLSGGVRVTIYDECQDASKGFWDAMLKTLEEPPKNNYFILCTTNPEKLPAAIKSRCSDFKFTPLNSKECLALLNIICDKEKVDYLPKDILEAIYEKVEGVPREALILLDKIIDMEGDEEILKVIESHISVAIDSEDLRLLSRALIDRKSWKIVRELLKKVDAEPESIRHSILNYIATVLLNSDGIVADRLFLIIEEFKETFIYSGRARLFAACYACTKF
uniref:Putative DNA polymerase n=1 Tax=viral metagenome TaxID=1070528 RepID=A0A6M3KYI5_9ZZZZ